MTPQYPSMLTGQLKRMLLLRIAFGRRAYADHTRLANAAREFNALAAELNIPAVYARRRGRRVFLIHQETQRIVCELGVGKHLELDFVTPRGIVSEATSFALLVNRAASMRRRKVYHGR